MEKTLRISENRVVIVTSYKKIDKWDMNTFIRSNEYQSNSESWYYKEIPENFTKIKTQVEILAYVYKPQATVLNGEDMQQIQRAIEETKEGAKKEIITFKDYLE